MSLLDELRFRAAAGDPLCLKEHELFRQPDSVMFHMRCDGTTINSIELAEPTSDDVRLFVERSLAAHERDVAASVVLDLIDTLRAAGDMKLMTDDEHKFMRLTGEVASLGNRIIGDGPQAEDDWAELAHRIHGVQHMVLRQCAARAYPTRYRQLGHTMREPS